jgi:plasmid stabilization system protein ParE
LKVRIAPRAQREAERIDTQWREAADHPEVFAEDFLEAVKTLEELPGIGSPWPTAKRPGLKRMYLKRPSVHLYFVREADEVRILCVWWSRRRKDPLL